MEEKHIQQLKQELIETVSKNPDKLLGRGDKTSDIHKNYALSGSAGKKVYESFTDEELLSCLQRLTEEIGYVPAQKEVFWVLKDYIKARFGKWPYALRAAGLPASAGKGGKSAAQIEEEIRRKEALLQKVREKALEMGKIPHPRDIPEIVEELRRFYDGWTEVIRAAGLDEAFFRKTVHKIPDLENEYLTMLEEVRDYAYKIGRTPLHGEIDESVKKALIKRCGSWRNVLYQVDLKPIMRMQPFYDIYIDYRKAENRTAHTDSLYGCYYEILNLNEADRKMLSEVNSLYKETGSLPMKKDVPKELRQSLLKRCGSWGNVLYQIGISPEIYYEEKKRHPENRKKKDIV